MEKVCKIFNAEIKQVGAEEDRVLRFTTSTEAIDRDGDIIEVDGWDLTNYMKNPVILYGHNYGGLPVGKSVNIIKDVTAKKLIQDVKFPTKEEYEFADTVYRLAKAGYLNATSVGFIGLESVPRVDEKGNYIGKSYKRQELLETSIVPVPSNPTALMEARSKGIINEKELKTLENTDKVKKIFEYDEEKNIFNVYDVEGEVIAKSYTVEFLRDFDPEEKSGATLSSKTKKMLDEIHSTLEGCGGKLRKFIDTSGMMMDEEDEDEEDDMPMENKDLEDIKTTLKLIQQDLAELKSNKPDESKADIGLENIEYPKNKNKAADIELNIESGELKAMISEIIQNELKGGI